MKKIKIAIYNLNTYPEMSGGSERSCLELAKELLDMGEDVAVVTLTAFKQQFQYFQYNGVDIFKLPLLNLYWPTKKKKRRLITKILWNVIDIANFPMAMLICIWLKKNGFNTVHTNNIKGGSPLIFPCLKIFGFKVIHTTRDYYLLDGGAWYRDKSANHNTIGLKTRRITKSFFSHFVDYVVFNSEYMKEYHNKCGFFCGKNNKVIYNGFNPDIYVNKDDRKCSINVFGYIGRMSEEKGIDILFDGFIKFPKGKYKLIIAGATQNDFIDSYPERKEIIEERDDVIFLGIVDNTEFYQNVDCVIVPSKYNEPFGRVAMEAIFMGKSVIVSPQGGLPEQIINGVNGIVCRDEDYYSAMNEMIVRNSQRSKNNEERPDLTKFTIANCAKEYLDVYREVNND
ncbi:glycosyltransferase [Brenneria goodwinii]|uniref:glycosyltransferase n=1 Tax=Brenneria goodwinii TaxID=1109412 RepID=UPI0036E8E864